MEDFIKQFDNNQLTNLQKSELNLINKLIESIKQNENNINEIDLSVISSNFDSELKNKLTNFENELNEKEKDIKLQESTLNNQINEIKQSLGIKNDQNITSVLSSVIKFKNSEKVFSDYESLIDKQESEINSLRTKIKLINEGSSDNDQMKLNKAK